MRLVTSLALVVFFGCTSTTVVSQPGSDGGAGANGSTSESSDPSSMADGGPGSSTFDAAAPLTGDVWVDANGKPIGLARTIPDRYGDAEQALIDAGGIAWRITPATGRIDPFDSRGAFYFTNDDCTGKRWLGNAMGASLGLPDVGVTTTLGPSYFDVFAIRPGAIQKPLTGYKSWDDPTSGCQSISFPSSPHGYDDADVLVVVAPTGFTAPFHVEHR